MNSFMKKHKSFKDMNVLLFSRNATIIECFKWIQHAVKISAKQEATSDIEPKELLCQVVTGNAL